MFGTKANEARQVQRATELFDFLRARLNTPISVRLWDGTIIPLGDNVHPGLEISLRSPGVIGTLLRRPKADTVLRLYAQGAIDFHGADLVSFIEKARVKDSRSKAKGIPLALAAKVVAAFVTATGESVNAKHSYQGDETGLKRKQEENADFIQFHYDVSNDFYRLFLDEQMVYSCAYFRTADDSLEQAQINKLDMICRKLS